MFKIKYKDKPDLMPDAPRKTGVFLFFELYFRKFWRLVTVNLLYFLFTYPLTVYVHMAIVRWYSFAFHSGAESMVDPMPGVGVITAPFMFIPGELFLPLVIVGVLLYGPVTMGVTYIYRNFAREEHVWTISDFFARAWSNVKQGLFFGIFDIIMLILLTTGVTQSMIVVRDSFTEIVSIVLRTMSAIVLVAFFMLRHYTYLQAVTVELGVIAILRNAMKFIVIGFGRNLTAVCVSAGVLLLCTVTFPPLSVLTLPFLMSSFIGFATIFTVYPVVKRYIVDAAERR